MSRLSILLNSIYDKFYPGARRQVDPTRRQNASRGASRQISDPSNSRNSDRSASSKENHDPLSRVQGSRVAKVYNARNIRRRRSPDVKGESANSPDGQPLMSGALSVKSEDGSTESSTFGRRSPSAASEDFDTPVKRTILDFEDPRVQGWAYDEIWTFNKLVMRSHEPLLPNSWAPDFPSFPDNLFTARYKNAFVSNLTSPVVEGTSALNTLIQAGPNCRSQLTTNHQPEPPIARSLQKFHKWALRDGRLHHKKFPQTIITVTAGPGESAAAVFDKCTKSLYREGRRWRKHLDAIQAERDEQFRGRKRRRDRRTPKRHTAASTTSETKQRGQAGKSNHTFKEESDGEIPIDDGYQGARLERLPILYAFLVKYSVMAITSWDPNPPRPPVRNRKRPSSKKRDVPSAVQPLRTLGTYNWKHIGQDVWHALAVAVVECKARNELMAMAKDGELGEDVEQSDPDV